MQNLIIRKPPMMSDSDFADMIRQFGGPTNQTLRSSGEDYAVRVGQSGGLLPVHTVQTGTEADIRSTVEGW